MYTLNLSIFFVSWFYFLTNWAKIAPLCKVLRTVQTYLAVFARIYNHVWFICVTNETKFVIFFWVFSSLSFPFLEEVENGIIGGVFDEKIGLIWLYLMLVVFTAFMTTSLEFRSSNSFFKVDIIENRCVSRLRSRTSHLERLLF